ncbi:related to KRE6-glucan synthase subunit [Sporisorium reilianum SRZ2]|uniref:Related to KRE6-glucan synthase subunit n=2 Tax=Sporisorium reilianum TaxID=72558 RepID=E6ZUE9_SPORE|nr:related to KRE6-glucan synthase subunit [Sporisorium reilianum SRZ2]SJX65882.1 related to KRE6-glucan synthase subunit [Sporisorium reilianum f. sp. reilianum]
MPRPYGAGASSNHSPPSSSSTSIGAGTSNQHDQLLNNRANSASSTTKYQLANNAMTEEEDDYLHSIDTKWDKSSHGWNLRGFLNVLTLALLALGLIMLFLGYPVLIKIKNMYDNDTKGAFGLGGTNGSGQVPALDIATLIDADTPQSALKWTSQYDQSSYHLVFSDEFEQDGRTFWPGDDPFWEAVDLWYSGTGDFEWYSPEAVNTTGGAMVIALEEYETHNKNFRSGMVQSWNKFCFQGGYIEFSVKLPGSPSSTGYWPAVWLMGNLGRPGYLATTEGTWPYSYQACDTGILPNQTFINGTGPYAAIHSTGTYAYNGELSYLPGMRYSSCTCPGEDHPGPNNNVGRSAPEIDIFEVQVQSHNGARHSYASQSLQVAPFDDAYAWGNASNQATIYDDTITEFNTYTGGQIQEAVSSVTQVPDSGFQLTQNQFVKYGVEFSPDFNYDGSGTITWYVDGKPSWTVNPKAFPARPALDISQRIIPVEPMAIVMNLAISSGFQPVDFTGNTAISFPAFMSIDYVRVYQKDGQTDRVSCDPPDHPTAQFIQNHMDLYFDRNLTSYKETTYKWPRNKLQGC